MAVDPFFSQFPFGTLEGIAPEAPSAAEANTDALPLSGVRVLDLSHVFQGPYATFLMAMAGAEIIKVEPPEGDICRRRGRDGDYPFRALNGCKQGIIINLKTDRGRELLLQLCRNVDVLVENFSPSVMPILGLGPEEVLRENPRLIYARSSGFGSNGPYAGTLAVDLTIQALSGLMSATGERDRPPLKAGAPVADFMAGAHFYGAIMTALFERERTGRGRVVEVSMLESMIPTLLPLAGHAYNTDTLPERCGNRHIADSYVPFDTFAAADGWIAIVCATDQHWLNLVDMMKRRDLRDDDDLRHLAGRARRIDEVTTAVAAWTADRTRADITTLCREFHIPVGSLQDIREVLADPHLRTRGFLVDQETASGTVTLPTSPLRYAGASPRPLTPPPALGADTDVVLSKLCSISDAELSSLRADGIIA